MDEFKFLTCQEVALECINQIFKTCIFANVIGLVNFWGNIFQIFTIEVFNKSVKYKNF